MEVSRGDPRWTSSSARTCQQCNSKFTMLLRKHHCRACGQLVCHSCSPYKTAELARVCRQCNALSRGASVTAVPDAYSLVDAAAHGDIIEVETWLAAGVHVQAQERAGGFTALHLAASNNHPEVVKLLLLRGADVDAAAFDGKTPLHLAAAHGAAAAVAALLKADASEASEDDNGDRPWHLALAADATDVMAQLQQQPARKEFPPPEPSGPGRFMRESAVVAAQPPTLVLPTRGRLTQRGLEVLDPAAQALQANLMAVKDEELKVVQKRQWQHDIGRLSVSRWKAIGSVAVVSPHLLLFFLCVFSGWFVCGLCLVCLLMCLAAACTLGGAGFCCPRNPSRAD